MKLRERLAMLAAFVPSGAKVADIGTDHAYLPIELVENKIVDFVIAGEVNPGPYKAAKDSIDRLGLQEQIQLRLGDGLSVVADGEVDMVVIAGMGGNTIIDILTKNPKITRSIKRFVLQPMIAASSVRHWLIENGWRIEDEALVVEEGKLYEFIVAEQGMSPAIEPVLYEIGPILWQKKDPLLLMHMNQLINQTKRILQNMALGVNAQTSDKYQLFREKLQNLEEKKECL